MARFLVEGMTCDGCARAVARAVEAALPGRRVVVDRAGGWIELSGEPADEAKLGDAIADAGFVLRGAAPRQF